MPIYGCRSGSARNFSPLAVPESIVDVIASRMYRKGHFRGGALSEFQFATLAEQPTMKFGFPIHSGKQDSKARP